MSAFYTYVYHKGSDTFFALEDDCYVFMAEEMSDEALESLEEAGSLRGFEDEAYALTENTIDNIRGLLENSV